MPVPREAERMPPPSPELILLATMTQAFLDELPRKRRAAFLRRVSTLLDLQVEFGNVTRLRPASEDEALDEARAKAAEWWRRALQLFVPYC